MLTTRDNGHGTAVYVMWRKAVMLLTLWGNSISEVLSDMQLYFTHVCDSVELKIIPLHFLWTRVSIMYIQHLNSTLNPLTTDDKSCNFGRMLSVGAIRFKIGFALAKKWAGFSTGCHAHGSCLAGCIKALVSTGLGISLFIDTNGHRLRLLCLFGCSISGNVGRLFSVGRSIHWSEGPDHCKLANEWAWQRSWTLKDLIEEYEYLAEVSSASS